MLSRANLLIQRDFDDLKEKPCEGIQVDLVSPDDVYEWTVKIKGNPESIWEAGILILILKFGEQYNEMPPDVFFYTVPFHPNVHPISGHVKLDLLHSTIWENSRSITKVLSAIQDLLSNPVLEKNILNKHARDMYIKSPHTYAQVIADCVRHSQQIELGLDLDIEDDYESEIPTLIQDIQYQQMNQRPPVTLKSKVSFQDYHFTWSDIATCKAKGNLENSYLESLKKNSKLYKMHTGQKLEEMVEENPLEQHEELSTLMYGNFKPRKTMVDNKKQRLANVRKMKNLYLHSSSDQVNVEVEKKSSVRLEPNDSEVNDLLMWSFNLDSTHLDTQ